MDMEKLVEKLRDAFLGEIKQEFSQFRAEVTGELSGFRLALESMSARQTAVENNHCQVRPIMSETNKRIDLVDSNLNYRIDNIIGHLSKRIDATNKRIDNIDASLNNRIDTIAGHMSQRLDETNKRIDKVFTRLDTTCFEVSKLRGDLEKALSQKVLIDDLVNRVTRLETKAA